MSALEPFWPLIATYFSFTWKALTAFLQLTISFKYRIVASAAVSHKAIELQFQILVEQTGCQRFTGGMSFRRQNRRRNVSCVSAAPAATCFRKWTIKTTLRAAISSFAIALCGSCGERFCECQDWEEASLYRTLASLKKRTSFPKGKQTVAGSWPRFLSARADEKSTEGSNWET